MHTKMIGMLLMAAAGAGASEPTNWWSNATEVVQVSEFFPEELRLSEGFHEGLVEGIVPVAEGGAWEVHLSVRTDESFDAPEEYVAIFIDGAFVDRVHNSPPGQTVEYVVPIGLGSMSYRFEFYSPVTFFSGHMVVEAGSIETRSCEADLNQDGSLNVLDFIAFQNAFQAESAMADCDGSGSLDVLDFVCFQGLFVSGCE